MSRTETLFHITQILRSREYTTAAYLAARLGIPVRTGYRNINDLSLSGIPVVSQTGKHQHCRDTQCAGQSRYGHLVCFSTLVLLGWVPR